MKAKKLLSVLLVLAMVFSMLPGMSLTANAAALNVEATCSVHGDAEHIRVGAVATAGTRYLADGSKTPVRTDSEPALTDLIDGEITTNTWYYKNGEKFVPCSAEFHGPAVPTTVKPCTCENWTGGGLVYIGEDCGWGDDYPEYNCWEFDHDGNLIAYHDHFPLTNTGLLVGEVYHLHTKNLCQSNLPTPLTFTAEEANSTITFDWDSGTDVKYSTDGTEWNVYTPGTAITLANVGDTVSFKGTNVTTSTQKHFVMTGKIAACSMTAPV